MRMRYTTFLLVPAWWALLVSTAPAAELTYHGHAVLSVTDFSNRADKAAPFLLEFRTNPTPDFLDRLSAAGITVVEPSLINRDVTGASNTLLVIGNPAALARFADEPIVMTFGEVLPQYKIEDELLILIGGFQLAWRPADIRVAAEDLTPRALVITLHLVSPSAADAVAELVQRNGGIILTPADDLAQTLSVFIPSSALAALADYYEVLWIERERPEPLSYGGNIIPFIGNVDILAPLRERRAQASGNYFVQFGGAVALPFDETLTAAGFNIIGYHGSRTYLVEGTFEELEELVQVAPIAGTAELQPSQKLSPDLSRLLGAGVATPAGNGPGNPPMGQLPTTLLLAVDVRESTNLDALTEEIVRLGGAVLAAADINVGSRLQIYILSDKVRPLTELVDVVWIEQVLPISARLDGGCVVEVGPAAGFAAPAAQLQGRGQTIGVADTGIDPMIWGARVDAGLRTDVVSWPVQPYPTYLNVGADDGTQDLDLGHGTHVLGIITGVNGISDGDYRAAPEADIFFQALEQSTTIANSLLTTSRYVLSGMPFDVRLLLSEAFENGVRIHSDSWGAAADGAYTYLSRDFDAFVWAHPEFVVVVAAGNNGGNFDGDDRIDQGTVNAPASAKNVIAVGASETTLADGRLRYGPGYSSRRLDGDLMTDNACGMAAFSARGPTDDGRIKPDLVAPGTAVISARAQHENLLQFQWLAAEGAPSNWFLDSGWRYDEFSKTLRAEFSAGDRGTTSVVTDRIDLSQADASRTGILQLEVKYDTSDNSNWIIEFSADDGLNWAQMQYNGVLNFRGAQDWAYWALTLGDFFFTDTFRIRITLRSGGSTNVASVAVRMLRLSQGGFWNFLATDLEAGVVGQPAFVAMNGTSMAAPRVAAGAALVREQLMTMGFTNPSAALVKAILINAASDLSPGQFGEGIFQEIERAPDPAQGWGRINMNASLLSPGDIALFEDISPGLETAQERSFQIENVAGPLNITLAYSDAPGPALVNNLDMLVFNPAGAQIYPVAGAAGDSVNNVERIVVPLGAPSGVYTIVVRATDVPVGPQPFALAAVCWGCALIAP